MNKQILFLFISLFSLATFAQTELPATATEISPLLIGERIPNITLKSVDNVDLNLTEILSKKKTILVFYRGGWCPYCNVHLAALGQSEKELVALGYQIIAVSPDAPKKLKMTNDKNNLDYLLLSDSAGVLSKAIGVAFQAPTNYKSILIDGSEGENKSLFIPVPSVFIVNTTSEIQFEYIAPDYKNRIKNDLLLAVAKSL